MHLHHRVTEGYLRAGGVSRKRRGPQPPEGHDWFLPTLLPLFKSALCDKSLSALSCNAIAAQSAMYDETFWCMGRSITAEFNNVLLCQCTKHVD